MELVLTRNTKDKISVIVKAWNEEFGDAFPLTEKLFKAKVIKSNFSLNKESICLFKNSAYIGSIFFKTYENCLYLSYIHIIKSERFKGYGKILLEIGERLTQKYKCQKIILGSDPDCLFSGVFMEKNDEVHRFFSNQGFTKDYLNYNLIARNAPPLLVKPDEYTITRANESLSDELLEFIKKNFSKRWLMEIKNNQINQVYLLKHDNQIIGFINSAISTNKSLPNSLNLYPLFSNLAGIGPLGIAPDFQAKGLGKIFVNYVVRDLFKRGASEVMVDWTGLVDFYLKCGFEEVFKTYIIYSKKVGKINEK